MYFFFQQFTRYVELSLITRTYGLDGVYYLAIVGPLCDLVACSVPYAITVGASVFVQRNLAKT